MYKLTNGEEVIRLSDFTTIPNDPGNALRQDYQKWLDGGGVPEPFETDAEKLSRLQGEWRIQRDLLMKEGDKYELPSFQKKYGVTQENAELFKSTLYDVPTTIEALEGFEWPQKLV